MTIQRVDHGDGSSTYESPLHSVHVPTNAQLAGDRAERERAELRRIVEVQASTIPADGNIGPSRHGTPLSFAGFQRKLVQDGVKATMRNLEKLRDIDDDPALGQIALDLAAIAEALRESVRP